MAKGEKSVAKMEAQLELYLQLCPPNTFEEKVTKIVKECKNDTVKIQNAINELWEDHRGGVQDDWATVPRKRKVKREESFTRGRGRGGRGAGRGTRGGGRGQSMPVVQNVPRVKKEHRHSERGKSVGRQSQRKSLAKDHNRVAVESKPDQGTVHRSWDNENTLLQAENTLLQAESIQLQSESKQLPKKNIKVKENRTNAWYKKVQEQTIQENKNATIKTDALENSWHQESPLLQPSSLMVEENLENALLSENTVHDINTAESSRSPPVSFMNLPNTQDLHASTIGHSPKSYLKMGKWDSSAEGNLSLQFGSFALDGHQDKNDNTSWGTSTSTTWTTTTPKEEDRRSQTAAFSPSQFSSNSSDSLVGKSPKTSTYMAPPGLSPVGTVSPASKQTVPTAVPHEQFTYAAAQTNAEKENFSAPPPYSKYKMGDLPTGEDPLYDTNTSVPSNEKSTFAEDNKETTKANDVHATRKKMSNDLPVNGHPSIPTPPVYHQQQHYGAPPPPPGMTGAYSPYNYGNYYQQQGYGAYYPNPQYSSYGARPQFQPRGGLPYGSDAPLRPFPSSSGMSNSSYGDHSHMHQYPSQRSFGDLGYSPAPTHGKESAPASSQNSYFRDSKLTPPSVGLPDNTRHTDAGLRNSGNVNPPSYGHKHYGWNSSSDYSRQMHASHAGWGSAPPHHPTQHAMPHPQHMHHPMNHQGGHFSHDETNGTPSSHSSSWTS